MKRFVFLTPMVEWNIFRSISCKMFNTKDVYVHGYIKAINKEKIFLNIMKLSVKNK
jgi:hypothetical protein